MGGASGGRGRHAPVSRPAVGHLPHLAKLAGLLLAGDAERPVVAFQPGGLVGLEQDKDGTGWSVFLVLPPVAASARA
jgi:phosphohistidine phosphatase SixA